MFDLLCSKEKSEFKDIKLSRVYEDKKDVLETQVYKNFEINKKYNKYESCEYTNFEFTKKTYEQMLEYMVIQEYNKIKGKGKDFINYV